LLRSVSSKAILEIPKGGRAYAFRMKSETSGEIVSSVQSRRRTPLPSIILCVRLRGDRQKAMRSAGSYLLAKSAASPPAAALHSTTSESSLPRGGVDQLVLCGMNLTIEVKLRRLLRQGDPTTATDRQTLRASFFGTDPRQRPQPQMYLSFD
jgi:hypothetical protein